MAQERREEGREDRQEEIELDLEHKTIKARGSDILTTIFGTAILAGVTLLVYGGYMHTADAAKESQAIVAAIKEATKKQEEMVNAQRETNCLARLDPKNRKESDVEFCRQLGRGH